MGCDIHTMVEVYREPYTYNNYDYSTRPATKIPTTVPGRWDRIKAPMWDYIYYDEKRPIGPYNCPYTDAPYSGRNYFLFSWLANVRNSSSDIVPLDEPRGVPQDASKAWKKYVKKWGSDLHSTSYFTLQELLDAEESAKAQTFTERGVLSLEAYLKLKDDGVTPQSWCGWTSAPTMTDAQFEALPDTKKLDLPRGGFVGQHIQTMWQMQLFNSLEWFYDHTVERMKNLIPKDGDASQVRLVFGFDN